LSRICRTSPSTWFGLADAQRGCRLVEDHDLAAERAGAGDGHRLALATGEGLDCLVDVLQGRNAEALDVLGRVALHRLRVEHPQTAPEEALAPDLAREVEVARDVERRCDGEGLVDRLDAGETGVRRRAEPDVVAVDLDAPLVRDHGAGQALDERRLARAVVADHRQDLARVQGQVDTAQADDPPEHLHQAVGLQHGRTHAFTLLIHWSTDTARMTRTPTASTW